MLHVEGRINLDIVADIDLTAQGVLPKDKLLAGFDTLPDGISELLQDEMFYGDEGMLKGNIKASWVNKTITDEK